MLLYQSDHIEWLPHKWSLKTQPVCSFSTSPDCPTNEIKFNIIPVCYILIFQACLAFVIVTGLEC